MEPEWTSRTEAVFLNGAGHPRNVRNLLRAFYPAMRKAGTTRFQFHDLRHTFATRLIQADVDVYHGSEIGPMENDLDGPALCAPSAGKFAWGRRGARPIAART